MRALPENRASGGMAVTAEAATRTGSAGQKLAFVSDPDGNRLELMEVPPESPIHW